MSRDILTHDFTMGDNAFGDKPDFNLQIKSQSRGSESSRGHGEPPESACESQWRPTVLSFRPLSALLALFVTVACMLASLAVLVISDRQPVQSWLVQPTVPLAILSAVGAGAIRYAKCSAAPIAWWSKALKGSSVRQLEDDWQANRGLLTSFIAFPRTPWLSLATILVTIMIIDGALLQRASSVALITTHQNASMTILLTPELPHGFSGIEQGIEIVATNTSSDVVANAARNRPMTASIHGCPNGTMCTGSVWAPGVSIKSCDNRTWPITVEMLQDTHATWGPYTYNTYNVTEATGEAVQYFTNPAFVITVQTLPIYSNESDAIGTSRRSVPADVNTHDKTPEAGLISVGIADYFDGSGGKFVEQQCLYEAAILEYDISWEAGIITPDLNSPRFVAWANNTERFSQFDKSVHWTTIDELTFCLDIAWNANVTVNAWTPDPTAARGIRWVLDPKTFNADANSYIDWGKPYGVGFLDPFPDILVSMNNFMFRGGLLSVGVENLTALIDPGLHVNQTFEGQQHQQEQIYTTDFRWFAGAAALDILVIIVVLPLFWGWWRLPRYLTQQSPFQMALAFDGPLVADVNSTAGSEGVVAKLGDTQVAYGLMTALTRTPSIVSESSAGKGKTQRLGFGDAANVTRPGGRW